MVEPYLEPQYRIPITQTLLPPKVPKPLQKSPEVLPSKTKEKLNRGPYRPETPDSGPEQTSDSDSEEEWPLVMRFDSIIPITLVYCLLPTSYSLLYVSYFCFWFLLPASFFYFRLNRNRKQEKPTTYTESPESPERRSTKTSTNLVAKKSTGKISGSMKKCNKDSGWVLESPVKSPEKSPRYYHKSQTFYSKNPKPKIRNCKKKKNISLDMHSWHLHYLIIAFILHIRGPEDPFGFFEDTSPIERIVLKIRR